MRAYARELAFQSIFERLFVKNEYYDEEFFVSLKKQEDKDFAKQIIDEYIVHKEEIITLLQKYIIGYEIDRVYKVDLAILCEAIIEICYIKTPYKIVVNEAVELAKKYSTEKSSKFVNGVLSAIIKNLSD